MRRFYKQKELTPLPTPLTEEEEACKRLYVRTHSRDDRGRYIVRLPVSPSLPALGETRRAAICMLRRIRGAF